MGLDVSEGGGACGEWTELDGVPTVALAGRHSVSRKHRHTVSRKHE